jgi:hypothetical protein
LTANAKTCGAITSGKRRTNSRLIPRVGERRVSNGGNEPRLVLCAERRSLSSGARLSLASLLGLSRPCADARLCRRALVLRAGDLESHQPPRHFSADPAAIHRSFGPHDGSDGGPDRSVRHLDHGDGLRSRRFDNDERGRLSCRTAMGSRCGDPDDRRCRYPYRRHLHDRVRHAVLSRHANDYDVLQWRGDLVHGRSYKLWIEHRQPAFRVPRDRLWRRGWHTIRSDDHGRARDRCPSPSHTHRVRPLGHGGRTQSQGCGHFWRACASRGDWLLCDIWPVCGFCGNYLHGSP